MPLSLADVLSAQAGGGPVYEGGPDANVTLGGVLSALGSTWPARVGQDIVQGAMAPGNAYRSTPENPVTTEQMIGPAANLAGVISGGSYAAPAMKDASGMAIRAYHGSPYDFEKFDISKIGTGEGAQSYGHGLYFAENPKVAEEYKRLTPQPQWKDPSYNPWTRPPGKMYEVNINAEPGQFLNWDAPLSQQDASVRSAYEKIYGAPDPKLAELRVRETDELMHALAGDRDPVTNQMRQEPEWFKLARERDKAWKEWERAQSGQKVYDALAGASAMRQSPAWEGVAPNTNRFAAASELLKKEGIPGIRYLDQGSRGNTALLSNLESSVDFARQRLANFQRANMPDEVAATQKQIADLTEKLKHEPRGTSNYVVFNPEIVDILKKYGLAGLTMGGVLTAAGQEPAPSQ